MIRYALRCAEGHEFESWFRDSAAFDALASDRKVACPCGSTEVRKALMTPSVVTARRKTEPVRAAEAPAVETPVAAPSLPPPAPMLDQRALAMRAALREIRRRMIETAENVGRGFATEARAIHEGDAPARAIYGEATRDEVVALLDDDIPLLPMPIIPDERH